MVEGLQEKPMSRICHIRNRIAPRLDRAVDILPPLFLPMVNLMINQEKRHEGKHPFQPLYAEAIAPREPYAPQDPYRCKRGNY